MKCSPEELDEIFNFIDRDDTGKVTAEMFENLLEECFNIIVVKIN
jgi:hypothetical protein